MAVEAASWKESTFQNNCFYELGSGLSAGMEIPCSISWQMNPPAAQATAKWGHLHISVTLTCFWTDHIAHISIPGLTCPGTVSWVEPGKTEGDKTSLIVAVSPMVFGS